MRRSFASWAQANRRSLSATSSSAASRVGSRFWSAIGAEPASIMRCAASSSAARGCRVYSPPLQPGSCWMPSISTLRHSRLRPAIGAGRHASAITASMAEGHRSAQSHECMQPIDVPITRAR